MAKGQSQAQQTPIARAFALTVLVALAALILLRHLFGSVTVNAGVK